jgi:tRNA threonylcarbamoyladenosine biosynthesis protein TsaE
MSTSAPELRLCPGPADTEALAAELAPGLKPGDVLLLSGELGAGKTCFTRGLARALGHADTVLSPTFQLMREHRGGRLDLFHVDLYRLAGPAEAQGLGLEEYFDGGGVCAVEWPERLGALAPAGCWRLHFEALDDGTRRVSVRRP